MTLSSRYRTYGNPFRSGWSFSSIFGRKLVQRTILVLLCLICFYIYGMLIHLNLPIDVDECQQNLHKCDVHARCINTAVSYDCKCTIGFCGDGRTCTDLNECAQNSDLCYNNNTECINSPGSYYCKPKSGFKGNDIEECLSNSQCHINAICTNVMGTYHCKCNPGFVGDGKSCIDIGECNSCHKNAFCTILMETFRCQCMPGFAGDGKNCTDIDECLSNNDCDKNAICTNVVGSYACQCNLGFKGNGKSCTAIPLTASICKDYDKLKYPTCNKKYQWLKNSNSRRSHPCYANHGVDGSDCSIRIYLSEVEQHCPLLPGRKRETIRTEKPEAEKLKNPIAKPKLNIQKMLAGIRDQNNFQWIISRITSMWGDWVKAYKLLEKKQDLTKRKKKQILVFPGLLADKGWGWANKIKRGGPLGELVQWADLIAALYILGHDLYISANVTELSSSAGSKTPCGDSLISLTQFDLIYTDIHGLQILKREKFVVSAFNCNYRILDSFGTEPRFNFMDKEVEESELSFNGSKDQVKDLRNNRYNNGDWRLKLPQFMTMFPHSPDNSFLGFVVGNESHPYFNMSLKEDKALVYGKQDYMWKEKQKYVDGVNKLFKVHGTVTQDADKNRKLKKLFNVPDYIINHGLMNQTYFQHFLKSIKVFVGVGFPFEGPAPLEAIYKGCVFLNPKINPPLNRMNDIKILKGLFFEGKPTLRKMTSQHPYLHQFVGKPHVFTIDINNAQEVASALNEIITLYKSGKIQPYLPYEFTNEGHLQRLNSYVENQDFCAKDKHWPPPEAMQSRVSSKGQSCKSKCEEEGLICDNSLFNHIKESTFSARGLQCKTFITKRSLYAPYVVDAKCVLQGEKLLFSCVDSAPNYQRLCPCRDFLKSQIALCKKCI